MKKSNKQTLILLIIFVIIIGSYFLYDLIKKNIDSKKDNKVSYLVLEEFKPESVQSIFVEDAIASNKFELKKENDRWRFVSPSNYKTDNSIIESYLEGFKQLYFKDKFEIESETSLKDFGLDKPQKTFVFNYTENGNQKQIGIIFGDRTPARDGIYLKVIDKPTIYIITLEAIQLIDFNANQLRNKMIFSNVNKDNISYIKFINYETKDENLIEFENQKYYWTASYNEKAKKILIPDENIKSILDRLFYLSAVDPLDKVPEKYKVEYEIIIGTKDGQTTKCIIFKKEKSPDDYQELYYAINENTGEMFTITMTTIKTFFTQKPYLLSDLIDVQK